MLGERTTTAALTQHGDLANRSAEPTARRSEQDARGRAHENNVFLPKKVTRANKQNQGAEPKRIREGGRDAPEESLERRRQLTVPLL